MFFVSSDVEAEAGGASGGEAFFEFLEVDASNFASASENFLKASYLTLRNI